MDDSAVGVNAVNISETERLNDQDEDKCGANLAGQTTPASKLRRFSGILDSAVRSFLSGCRSPLNATNSSQGNGSMELDDTTGTLGNNNNDDATNVVFSPGARGKEAHRKRRVPLSSMNNFSSTERATAAAAGEEGSAAAGAGLPESHSAVKAAGPHHGVGQSSPAACDLITSSQRKKSKKKRLNIHGAASGAGGAPTEAENVSPRNLNKMFSQTTEENEQADDHQQAEETCEVGSAQDGATASRAGDADGNRERGAATGGGAGGVLSNLLFSPMFTLLGPKITSKFTQQVAPEDQGGALAEEEEEAHEEAGDKGNFSVIAAADLSCEEKSLEADEAEEGPYCEEEDEDDVEYEYSQSFDPFYFIKNLPPLELCVPAYRKSLLPRQTRQQRNRKTLVLDLDETLVHSSLENELPQDPMGEQLTYDFTFPVHLGEERYDVYVYVRPGAVEFLEKMQELYEVVVFTASQKMYAEKLLNILDPQRRYIRHRLFRDSCVLVEGNYLKDLSIIGRDLKDTIIVDNSPQAFAFQLSNGVPIESWFDDQEDQELLKLIPFLRKLTKVDDVRPSIERRFKLHEKVQAAV